VPLWRSAHDEVDRLLQETGGSFLRAELLALSNPQFRPGPCA
jgi:hypothetical protein